jgi:hypothetical protein
MVKGPCRGKSCDFWARVKVRKISVTEMVAEIREALVSEMNGCHLTHEEALHRFWLSLGIQDMDRLCYEEPQLCKKIRKVEGIILDQNASSTELH